MTELVVTTRRDGTVEVRLPGMFSPRKATVYKAADGHRHAGRWVVRCQKFPEDHEAGSGWFGGRMMQGHDRETSSGALELARAWVADETWPAE